MPIALVPADCVKVPVPPLPTNWQAEDSDPPLIPDTRSLLVRVPLPNWTIPLAESTRPPLRLIAPADPAAIVPWQTTGSLTAPEPPKPWPAGTVSVVPSVWVIPKLLKAAKLVEGLNPAGTINRELAAIETEMLPRFCSVPPERSRMPLPLMRAAALPPLKTPWFSRLLLTCKRPPPRR